MTNRYTDKDFTAIVTQDCKGDLEALNNYHKVMKERDKAVELLQEFINTMDYAEQEDCDAHSALEYTYEKARSLLASLQKTKKE